MTQSMRRLAVVSCLALASLVAMAPVRSGPTRVSLRDGMTITLPCGFMPAAQVDSTSVSIASIDAQPGTTVEGTLTVRRGNGNVVDVHDWTLPAGGSTFLEPKLPPGFFGVCVIDSDQPVVAVVNLINPGTTLVPGGSTTPVFLAPTTTLGSDSLLNVLYNKSGTVTTKAFLMNPTDRAVGISKFCNDAANNPVGDPHWDLAAGESTLSNDLMGDGNTPGDLSCCDAYNYVGGLPPGQPASGFGLTTFAASGDRLVDPGALVADLRGRDQFIPLVHGTPDGSSSTSLKLQNIGAGTASVKLIAYDRTGKRVGKKTRVRVPEGNSVRVDSVYAKLDIPVLAFFPVRVRISLPPNNLMVFVTAVLSEDAGSAPRERTEPSASMFATVVPAYTEATAIQRLGVIVGFGFEAGDSLRFGAVNAGKKAARILVRVLDENGEVQLSKRLKLRKHGGGEIEFPESLAGRTLHVEVEVDRKGPIMAFVEEHRASGEINFYPAQPLATLQNARAAIER